MGRIMTVRKVNRDAPPSCIKLSLEKIIDFIASLNRSKQYKQMESFEWCKRGACVCHH